MIFGEEPLGPSTSAPGRSGVGIVAYYPMREGGAGSLTSPDVSGRELATPMQFSEKVEPLGTRGVKILAGGEISFDLGEGISRIAREASLSIELWVRPASSEGAPRQRICALGGVDAPLLEIAREGSSLVITGAGAEPFVFEDGLPNLPTQLVITHNDEVVRVYLEGLLVMSWITSWDLSSWRSGEVRCGAGSYENSENEVIDIPLGDISLIAVYDRALRPAEVWSHYEVGDHGSPESEGFTIAADLLIEHVGRRGPSRTESFAMETAHINGLDGQELARSSALEIGDRRTSFIRWIDMPVIEPYSRGYLLFNLRRSSGNEPVNVSAGWALKDWVRGQVTWSGPSEEVPWEEPGAAAEGVDRSPSFAQWSVQFNGPYHLALPAEVEDLVKGREGSDSLMLWGETSLVRVDDSQWYRSPQLLFVRSREALAGPPGRPDISTIERNSSGRYISWRGDEDAIFEVYRNKALIATTRGPFYQDDARVSTVQSYAVVACTPHRVCSGPSAAFPFSP